MQEQNRRRLEEKLTSATLSLKEARRSMKEALTLAYEIARKDTSLNTAILEDYDRTVTQLLSHMDMWKLPIETRESET